MRRPIIGITTYLEEAAWGPWEKPAVLLPATYVRNIEAAGGRPLLIAPSTEGIEETLDALDGIIFSGGSDLDPRMYGQIPHAETRLIRPERDGAEAPLLSAALDRDIAVLCICRGMELLNVVRGGTLIQHLEDLSQDVHHKAAAGAYSVHEVSIKPDSKLGSMLGTTAEVHSHHHQAPDVVGEGLLDVAWAPDGVIEGIEDPSKRFALGVIWHPEEGHDPTLFEAFIEAVRGDAS